MSSGRLGLVHGQHSLLSQYINSTVWFISQLSLLQHKEFLLALSATITTRKGKACLFPLSLLLSLPPSLLSCLLPPFLSLCLAQTILLKLFSLVLPSPFHTLLMSLPLSPSSSPSIPLFFLFFVSISASLSTPLSLYLSLSLLRSPFSTSLLQYLHFLFSLLVFTELSLVS